MTNSNQFSMNVASTGRATEADKQNLEAMIAANHAAAGNVPAGPQIKIGGQRFVFEGGQARMEATDQRYTVGQDARPTESGLNIRDHLGRPVNSLKDAKDSDVVTLPGGLETSIANARRSGLLDEDHRLTAQQTQTQQAQDNQQSAERQEAPALLDGSTEAMLSSVTADTTAHTQLKALGEIAAKGDLSQQTLASVAAELNVSPAEAAQVVSDLRAAFERQATAAVKNLGFADAEAVWSWAYQNAPDLMAKAIDAHGRQRSTAGYQAVAQAYLAALPSVDASAVMDAECGPGLSLSKAADGKVVVNVQGRGSFEWSQAVRMGIIKVSGV